MKMILKTMMTGTLLLSSLAHAQSGAQGGGSFTEAQMKDFMGELSRYFDDAQSRTLFPEVDAWEKASGAKFAQLIHSIEPKVVNHKVYGPFKEERDCVSFVNGTTRYFECDRSRVPESRLENQPLLYTILLHEAFVHAGIEKPTSETVPSKYPVSSRIGNTQNLSLVTYQKWVPGSAKGKEISLGVQCEYSSQESLLGHGRTIILQANEQGARLIVGETATGAGLWLNRLSNKQGGQPPASAQLAYPLYKGKERFTVDRETGERIGSFSIELKSGIELEFVVDTRAEDVNRGLMVYVKDLQNGRISNTISDLGRCHQVTYEGVGFELASGSVIYGFTHDADPEKLLERTARWLKRVR